MAGSATRKAAAICAVVRPQTTRRVSAICDSRGRAGWQQAKIIPSSSSSASSSLLRVSLIRATWASLSRPARARRSRSMALRRAVVASQPPGLGGTWPSGQCSRASTKASWTASAARPTSPILAASAAVIRAASAR